MSDKPVAVAINEEGPREGFQIESGSIATQRKVELIDALSETGLKHMQIVSFVNPKRVPGMADAEEVVKGIKPKSGVDYTALWLNEKGLERAMAAGRLKIEGKISLCPSEKFLKRNQNKSHTTIGCSICIRNTESLSNALRSWLRSAAISRAISIHRKSWPWCTRSLLLPRNTTSRSRLFHSPTRWRGRRHARSSA